MKWTAFLLTIFVVLLTLVSPRATASPYELIPGTGIPVPPNTSLDAELGNMPSEDELMLLFALSQLSWAELPGFLADLGLNRWWWEANLEVSLHAIPSHLPEGAAYNAFIEYTYLPTGELLGCYLQTGTADIVCVDEMPAVAWYPLLLSGEGFLDLLFPLMAHHIGGQQAGASLQWDCFDLRANSPNAGAAGLVGFAGGAGTAATVLTTTGAGAAIYSSVGTFIAGAVAANGAGTAAAATVAVLMGSMAGAAVVVGAVVVVGVVAAVAAHQSYSSGAIGGCPGCGEGYDPQSWTCYVRAAADMCICEPRSEGSGTGETAGTPACHDEPPREPEGPRPHDWTDVDLGEFAGCSEWESHQGVDNEACSSCGWYQEPEDIQTPNQSQEEIAHGCDVCTGGDAMSVGEVRCWSISVGAP